MTQDKIFTKGVIELERSGSLDVSQKKALLDFLKTNAQLVGEYDQSTIFIESGSVYLGQIQNTKHSIALMQKVDCVSGVREVELKVKRKKKKKSDRVERRMWIHPEDIISTAHLFKVFGITHGCPRYYHRCDYTYGGYSISIKEGGYAPDHFEIESIVEHAKNIAEVESGMIQFAAAHGLRLYSDEEYKAIMLGTFDAYPPVELTEELLRTFYGMSA